jgi:hypothetical protein
MAASHYKIPKGIRVGLANRFRLTATTFVLAKSILRRIRDKTAISQAASFWFERIERCTDNKASQCLAAPTNPHPRSHRQCNDDQSYNTRRHKSALEPATLFSWSDLRYDPPCTGSLPRRSGRRRLLDRGPASPGL